MAAHPAFPSLPQPGPSLPAPTSSESVLELIQSCDTITSIRSSLLPLLNDLSLGSNAPGDKKARSRRGEDILCLNGQDLAQLGNDVLFEKTAGLIYVISARLDERSTRWHTSDTFDLALRLCNVANSDQLSLCGPRVGKFAWGLLDLAKQLRQTRDVLQALQSLLERSARRGTFSAVHAVYLETCLLERSYHNAQPIIDEVFLDLRSAQPTYLDVLTFHHHAGLILVAIGDYARARDFFVIAVSAPSSATSAIQIACAKRAILCELLISGKAITFPRYTVPGVTRNIERSCQEYHKIAKAYEAQDWEAVRRAGEAKQYEKDCNLGLIQAVLDSVTKWRIVRLRETYSRMSLEDLAEKVGLEGGTASISKTLGDMIATRAIEATILPASEQSKAIVTFHQLSLPADPAQTLAEIQHASAMAGWLESHLTDYSKDMGLSDNYLRKQAEIHNVAVKSGPDSGGHGGGKGGKAMEDFESMMMSEEFAVGGRVGADYGDDGY